MHLSFFLGKGGVGKTTISSAFAVHSALQRPRESVLLISTDPAHSLADIFEIKLGDSPRRIPTSKGKLFAWQINAEKLFGKFLARYREPIFSLLESGTIFSRKEIVPLLSTNLPGMAEMAALLAIHDLLESKQYQRLVVDTAPLGHTLRLFQMPEHFLRFLNFLDVAASRDATLAATFGGKARLSHVFLQEWRAVVEKVQEALRSAESRLVLVATPESFSLEESLRAVRTLAKIDLKISQIVLNRVVTTERHCRVCQQKKAMTRKAESFLKKNFIGLPIFKAEDTGAPILSAKELANYGAHVFAGKKFSSPRQRSQPDYHIEKRLRRSAWPIFDVPLALTLGKGGVGKTTISAALAFTQRQRSKKTVMICSTDPAPSLDDVFQQKVGDELTPVLGDPGLLAAELDSVAEFRRWSQRMKDTIERAFSSESGGLHIDFSFDRQIFSALLDIVPPGVDEILAIFRLLDLLETAAARGKKASMVILDMAPTGHALELLRMPGRMLLWSRLLLKALARHRTLPLAQDAAVEIAAMGQRVRELDGMLRDPSRSLLVPVMLAEPLPDRETSRLMASLKELGATTSPIFVNRILFQRDIRDCSRCRRARTWQLATLRKLEEGLAPGQFLWVAPNFPEEIAGRSRLKSFTHELWRLQRAANVKPKRSRSGAEKRPANAR